MRQGQPKTKSRRKLTPLGGTSADSTRMPSFEETAPVSPPSLRGGPASLRLYSFPGLHVLSLSTLRLGNARLSRVNQVSTKLLKSFWGTTKIDFETRWEIIHHPSLSLDRAGRNMKAPSAEFLQPPQAIKLSLSCTLPSGPGVPIQESRTRDPCLSFMDHRRSWPDPALKNLTHKQEGDWGRWLREPSQWAHWYSHFFRSRIGSIWRAAGR